MTTTIRVATDLRDQGALARFRREVRSLNLGRLGRDPDVAADPRADGKSLCAFSGGDVVGTLDVHWGGEVPLPPERTDALGVVAKTGSVGADNIVVLDEVILHPDWQLTTLDLDLKHTAIRYAGQRRARWVFATCGAQDIATHRAVGFTPCAAPVSLPDVGFRVPVVLDLLDVDHLVRIGSPLASLARMLRQTRPDADAESSGMVAAVQDGWRQLHDLIHAAQRQHAAFLGALSPTARGQILGEGTLVEPRRGDAIVRRGQRGRDLYLVLRGAVVASRDGRQVAVLGAGEVFGEIGFLLETERTADVVAATDDVAMLKLSHAGLTKLTRDEPAVAASLSLGIAHALCLKLMAGK